jgi:quercetin dioxygenase-like cupin family protein
MTSISVPTPLVRHVDAAERRWFYGGGIFTWLARAEDTAGAFLLWEDQMEQGKVTPLHTHPAEETMYVLDGEILLHIDGTEHRVEAGDVAMAPRGVAHAFLVVSTSVRMLTLQTPGTCQAFYLGASDVIDAATNSGPVDFDRVAASAHAHGGIDILGPPPFARP